MRLETHLDTLVEFIIKDTGSLEGMFQLICPILLTSKYYCISLEIYLVVILF